ncbi:hypothetical protein EZS27_039756 [termite gut metagenome]|uniref:Uncharacterized protein n=1 Tax=termite gut metagenome TaxID=433724 RepID=A0A5J4PIG8_9ZZZZ
MEDWQKECMKTIYFSIRGEKTPIEVFVDEQSEMQVSFVYTPRYRPTELMPRLDIPTLSVTNKMKILLILKKLTIIFLIFYISINKSQIFSMLISITCIFLSNNSFLFIPYLKFNLLILLNVHNSIRCPSIPNFRLYR